MHCIYFNSILWYNHCMTEKYTIKRAFRETITGYEKVVWHIMDGDFVVDACDMKRDAKYYADKWNAAEHVVTLKD